MQVSRYSWRSCLLAVAVMCASIFTAGFTASAAASPSGYDAAIQRAVAPLVISLDSARGADALPAVAPQDVLGGNMVRTSAHRPRQGLPLTYVMNYRPLGAARGLDGSVIEGGVGQYRS